MSKKKVLLRGVFINRDTNGEGVLKVGTTLIRVSTVMGILYSDFDVAYCGNSRSALLWKASHGRTEGGRRSVGASGGNQRQ